MNREQALETLKEMAFTATESYRQALETAISALSENKGDLISRQAVLNTLDFADNALTDEVRTVENFKALLTECIKVLPSVENKGEWIEHDIKELRDSGYYRCSVCRKGFKRFDKGIRKSDVPWIDGQPFELHIVDNYCPNCGARMKGGE